MPNDYVPTEVYYDAFSKANRQRLQFTELRKHIAELTDLQKLEIAAKLLSDMQDKYGEEVNFACNEPAGILEDIREGAFETAIAKASGNWEPPERGDAWSGGFADNH